MCMMSALACSLLVANKGLDTVACAKGTLHWLGAVWARWCVGLREGMANELRASCGCIHAIQRALSLAWTRWRLVVLRAHAVDRWRGLQMCLLLNAFEVLRCLMSWGSRLSDALEQAQRRACLRSVQQWQHFASQAKLQAEGLAPGGCVRASILLHLWRQRTGEASLAVAVDAAGEAAGRVVSCARVWHRWMAFCAGIQDARAERSRVLQRGATRAALCKLLHWHRSLGSRAVRLRLLVDAARQRLTRRPLRRWSRFSHACRQRAALYGPRVRALRYGSALAAALHRWHRVAAGRVYGRRPALTFAWGRWGRYVLSLLIVLLAGFAHLPSPCHSALRWWKWASSHRPLADEARQRFRVRACGRMWSEWHRSIAIQRAATARRRARVQDLVLADAAAARWSVRPLRTALASWQQRQARAGWLALACTAAQFGVRLRRQRRAVERWRQHHERAVLVHSTLRLATSASVRGAVYKWRGRMQASGRRLAAIVQRMDSSAKYRVLRVWQRIYRGASELVEVAQNPLRQRCHAALARWRSAHAVRAEISRRWAAAKRCFGDVRRRCVLRTWRRRGQEMHGQLRTIVPLLEAAHNFSLRRMRRSSRAPLEWQTSVPTPPAPRFGHAASQWPQPWALQRAQ